jgi:protein-arginine kinase activator protein McsA
MGPSWVHGMVAAMLDRERPDTCPHCGWTWAAVEANLLVGCPLCYDVWKDTLKTESQVPGYASHYSVSSTHPL